MSSEATGGFECRSRQPVAIDRDVALEHEVELQRADLPQVDNEWQFRTPGR